MIAGMINRRSGAIFVAAVAIAVFVLVNLGVSAMTGVRLDLTEDKLFTLSDGTRNILKSLSKPVTLTLYYSPRLGEEAPPFGLHATRVRDMIREFSAVAGENLTFEEKHPEPFSETEDEAVEAGLHGIPLDETGEKAYFGLVSESGDAKGVIPLFQLERDRFLEYDLARAVAKLENPDPARVGVWTHAPMFGDMTAQMRGMPVTPWAIISQLQEHFAVKQIHLARQLTDDVDVLILAHATRLDDEEFYAIDQYLMRGGKAIIFVDPFNEGAASRRLAMNAVAETSSLKKLFDTWGVEMSEDKLAGDMSLARLVNAGTEQQVIPAPYVTWLELNRDNISDKDLVTADLNQINVASAGVLRLRDDAAVKAEPLLWTTRESQLVDVKHVSGPEPDIRGMVERFEPSGKRQVLAMRLTGKVKSAFPDGPPKEEEPKEGEKPANDEESAEADAKAGADTDESGKQAMTGEKAGEPEKESAAKPEGEKSEASDEAKKEEEDKPKRKPHVGESQVPLNLIVVADADMLSNGFWVQIRNFLGRQFQVPMANNGDFVLNAVENLSGSNDLISLRSRGSVRRPFTRLQEMQAEAQEKYKAEEQRLMRQLEETEKKLRELRGAPGAGDAEEGKGGAKNLTPEQQAEVDRFRDELLSTRQALRQVRHNLRKDIDALRNRLSFINIALVPLLVTVAAAGLGAARVRRRKRAAESRE